jgi:hypothetical protein
VEHEQKLEQTTFSNPTWAELGKMVELMMVAAGYISCYIDVGVDYGVDGADDELAKWRGRAIRCWKGSI